MKKLLYIFLLALIGIPSFGQTPQPIRVGLGGTGVTTLTGIVKGNGASAFSVAAAGDFPTLNQNTTGTAASLSAVLAANLGGAGTVSGMLEANGSGTVSAATSGTDYSAGTSSLATGIIKSTTTTGALTIAAAGDFPVLNQTTTGSAAKWTTARNLAGNSVDGSANVAFSNKFIAQGASDAGLSGAQFLGALATGIVKNTTTTGVLSVAIASDFPVLNQNTSGTAASLSAVLAANLGGAGTVSGMLEANGSGTVSAATSGTDYSAGTSALATGILKSTTTTGALTIAAAGDFPTLNQATTGSAAKWTTARNLAGNSVDGSANVAFANKFIVQGASDAGLSGAQFLGALATGMVKNTTTTGVLSVGTAGTDYSKGTSALATGILKSTTTTGALTIAASGDFPTLNQTTTGSAAKWTTARNLAGNSVDGSANVAFSNKFIAQGTADTGLSGAQFLGALATGITKNTTTTGVLSIATSGTDYSAGTSGLATGVLKSTITTGALSSMTGTANYVTRWVDGTTLGTGISQDNGTSVGIGVAPTTTLDVRPPSTRGTATRTVGTGLNDITASGTYTGAAVSSTYTVTIDGNGGIGSVASAPTNGGTGYAYYDTLVVTTGSGTATLLVTGVTGGVVTSVALVKSGSGYSSGAGQATSSSPGTGCTINITSTADTFKWRQDTGEYTFSVPITTVYQTLSNGVTVALAATSGHTVGDAWTIACTTIKPFQVQNAVGTSVMSFTQDGVLTVGSIRTLGPTAAYLENIALDNNSNIPKGYIKFVTPIRTANNQMFSIDITGYDYNAGKSIDFTVCGYAYGASDTMIQVGFANRSSFSRQVRIALEDRGAGYRVMVITLGTPDGSANCSEVWYFQKFGATVRMWSSGFASFTPDQFMWVKAETSLATGYYQSANLNNQVLDGALGTITTSGAVSALSYAGAGTGLTGTAASLASGTAAKWTTARTLAGNSVDGSANVAFANKFIIQGTADAGLSGPQFLGALGTGIVKNTTTTGVLSIAAAGDFPALNQSSTGSAGSLKSPTTTGLMTATGMTAGQTRVKTVRDANDTLLELGGGSYTPTGTWVWTSATATWPTFNQTTTGSAAKWTTARTLAGNSTDGSANVAFANKFIVQGTADAGLSGSQFLGALTTGMVKNTTTTGVLSIGTAGTDYSSGTSALASGIVESTTSTGALSIATSGTDYSLGTSALATGILKSTTTTGALTIAAAGDFPALNQSTTGSAAKWTTARNLAGNSVDGSANVAFVNKFIVQGTTDAGLSGSQFLGALTTGIVKNTTSTGVLSIGTSGTDYSLGTSTLATGILKSTTSTGALTIAAVGDFPTFNQNTSGTAASLSAVLAANLGGAGTVSGMMEANGAGTVSAATSGTDYSAGTSALATGILKSTTTTGALTIAAAGDFPTLNQSTTGSAAKWTTARNLAGNSVDGSANVAFANKFVVQGTTDAGLSGAQFLGALATGMVKNTTSTGVLSVATSGTDYSAGTSALSTGILKSTTSTGALTIAASGDFPALNQSSTGSAGSLKSTATTGLMTISGPGAGVTRAKTIRDADDTLLELGGSYTPSGTWVWTSATTTWPTFNQTTTGSAAKWTTARTLAGNSVDGSANATFSNKFIVQGTTDAGLTGSQFLGALATGMVKNTTTTGVLSVGTAGTDYSVGTSALATGIVKSTTSTGALSIATSGTDYSAGTSSLATGIVKSTTTTGALTIAAVGDFPTFNQTTTGSAAKWTTARNLAGNSVDGSANVAFANKLIVQGTTDAGLSGAQFLGALTTGMVKNTTSTGVLTIGASGTDYAPGTSALTTGILKSTTTTGALTIAAVGDFPTLNQSTTGSAAKWTTARTLAGNSADGSANVAFSNKFVVQGTTDAGLSGAQFLGALATGMVKNTTSTGVLSVGTAGTDYSAGTSALTTGILKSTTTTGALTIAASGDFPTLNQSTTGSAAKWTTARNLAGNSVDGSANATFANKFIVKGTTDTGLTGAQFLGALGTGIVKNTTTTGVLSISTAGTDYSAGTSALATGILKSTTSTGALTIASAGSDYLAPTGSGTGLSGIPTLAGANAFTAANTFTTYDSVAITGTSSESSGVAGLSTTYFGVYGSSDAGGGVVGHSVSGTGVTGDTATGYSIQGTQTGASTTNSVGYFLRSGSGYGPLFKAESTGTIAGATTTNGTSNLDALIVTGGTGGATSWSADAAAGGNGAGHFLTGGDGGTSTSTSAVSNRGGIGGGFTVSLGTGGGAYGTKNGATGGRGGATQLMGGSGGDANGASGNIVGGAGGFFTLISGTGGSSVSTTGIGGAGGNNNIYGGRGGATTASTGTPVGGVGGSSNLYGGTGGDSAAGAEGGIGGNGGPIIISAGTGGEGTSTGGNGGDITFTPGPPGAGDTPGSIGNIIFAGPAYSEPGAAYDTATLGSERLDATTWTVGSGWAYVSGSDWTQGFTHSSGTTALSQSDVVTIGNFYKVSWTVTNRTVGTFSVSLGSQATSGQTATSNFTIKATSTTGLIITPTTDFNGTVVLSVKAVPVVISPTFSIYDASGTSNLEIRSSTASLLNTYIGKNSGQWNTTGSSNTALGNSSLASVSSGSLNTSVGYQNLKEVSIGSWNTAIGNNSLIAVNSGGYNIGIGSQAAPSLTTSSHNIGIGYGALFADTTSSGNVAIGTFALYSTTATGSIAIGFMAGKYSNAAGEFYINNKDQTNTATEKANSLLYGVMGAAATNQTLAINAATTISGTGLVKPISNSATAFQVQPAASTTPVLDVDTSNSRVGIGKAAPTVALDVVGGGAFTGVINVNSSPVSVWRGASASAPSTTLSEGQIYFNTSSSTLMVYYSSAWHACFTAP